MSLQGRKVLLVEDEPLLLMELTDIITEIGCEGIPSVGGLQGALEQARDLPLDAAVLDVNLAGQRVDPLANLLDARGIPFLFATGCSERLLPQQHRTRPLIEKPYRREEVAAALMRCLGADAMPSL